MSKNALGISWVHGRLHAVVLSGSRRAASWECPHPVAQPEEFETALGEAVRATAFSGSRVFVVLEHRSLLFHVQETPPATGRTLEQLLERLVAQNRFFEERAAWGRVQVPAAKGKQRFLLALLPESLVRQIAGACTRRRLQLCGVFPLAAALGAQLRQLSVPDQDLVVLAAESAGSLHLLLGRGDGQVLFSRSVVLAGAQKSERAAQEINRTIYYAQQQFASDVTQLFVFGDAAYASLKEVQIRQGLKIHQSPVPDDVFLFATQAVLAVRKNPLNLVSLRQTRRRQGRQLAAAALVALLACTGGTVAQVERVVRARETKALSLEQELDEQVRSQSEAIARQQEARRWTAFTELVDPSRHPPVPELFLRYLSARLPAPVRFSDLQFARETNGWTFLLQGYVQAQAGGMQPLLDSFEQELNQGLFRATIVDGTHHRAVHGAADNGPIPSKVGARENEQPFFLSGLIQ